MQPDAAPLEKCASPSRVLCGARVSSSLCNTHAGPVAAGRHLRALFADLVAVRGSYWAPSGLLLRHCIFCTQFLEHVLGRWQLADTSLALYADMAPEDAELMAAWLQKHRDATLKPFTKARAMLSLYGTSCPSTISSEPYCTAKQAASNCLSAPAGWKTALCDPPAKRSHHLCREPR